MKYFQPKKNQNYWMINSRWEVKQSVNTGSKKFDGRVRVGNCFATKEEAQEFLNKSKLLRKGKLVIIGTDLTFVQKVKFILRGRL